MEIGASELAEQADNCRVIGAGRLSFVNEQAKMDVVPVEPNLRQQLAARLVPADALEDTRRGASLLGLVEMILRARRETKIRTPVVQAVMVGVVNFDSHLRVEQLPVHAYGYLPPVREAHLAQRVTRLRAQFPRNAPSKLSERLIVLVIHKGYEPAILASPQPEWDGAHG